MINQSTIFLFIDDEPTPYGQFLAPVKFDLDTSKLVDGEHVLKIVSKDPNGKEGIRKIPFTVRNGPDIALEGIAENDVVDGIIPIMINAYGKGNQTKFLLEGSETPQSIPAWFWAIIIGFVGWAIYYTVTSLTVNL